MHARRILSVVIFIMLIVLAIHTREQSAIKEKITGYYGMIREEELAQGTVEVTSAELEKIRKCQSGWSYHSRASDNCTAEFYREYTIAHGISAALAHLARIQGTHPEVLRSCHYASHGIGEGALELNGANPFKSFSVMQDQDIFNNIASCGNGYFHGVIVEFSRGAKDNDSLIKLLKPICANKAIINEGDCYHGIGHAAMIQTNASIDDLLYICDHISDDAEHQFQCYSGGFMENGVQNRASYEIHDGKLTLTLCDSLDRKYQTACYLEQSSFFELLTNKSLDYSRNIGYCKQISDDINRMACVKLFAIRAVRIAQYPDVAKMCANTSSPYEQLACTTLMAQRIAQSLDRTRLTPLYVDVLRTVCSTLGDYREPYCLYLSLNNLSRVYGVGEQDLTYPVLPS